MKFPESIGRVTVELKDGRWVSFTREDLIAAESFCASYSQLFSLLAFIAGLSPAPDPPDPPDPEEAKP